MNDNRLRELINGCLQYDRTCQKDVYQLFYRYALSVAMRYAKSADEAREIVNDAFFQVFTKIEKYNPEQPFQPWLHTITVRTAIDYYRKYHLHKIETEEADVLPEPATPAQIIADMEAEELRALVQELPPAYRMAINLYAIEGMEHHEIADLLGITTGTSKSNLFKARAKLKTMLAAQNNPKTYKKH